MGYQLKNDQLVVDIAEVGQYRGARFEWAGFITGVTLLNGNHSFCVPESLTLGQGTGGAGLCNEFGLQVALGYDETLPGEEFPKLGIGLLTRLDEEPYDFSRKYPVNPFEVEVKSEGTHKVTYSIQPKDCRGYAASLIKSISIDANRLTVEHRLHNTGTKSIATEEYCHNFLGIDTYSVGPDYVLKFPFELAPWADEEGTMDGLVFDKQEVSWSQKPNKPFYFRLPGFDGNRYDWMWELQHSPSGTGVREISKFQVSSAAVWGAGHVISPEMFIDVRVEPGETKSWSRIYEFFTKPAKTL